MNINVNRFFGRNIITCLVGFTCACPCPLRPCRHPFRMMEACFQNQRGACAAGGVDPVR